MNATEYARSLCRLLHFGVPPGDVLASQDQPDWETWSQALARRATRYAVDGQRALNEARFASAEALLRTAAVCFHYAQFKSQNGEARAIYRERSRRAFALAVPLSRPPAEPVAIPFEELRLPGYVRRAGRGSGKVPVPEPWIVLLNGLDSAKEVELDRFADGFVRRGMNVVYCDLPGLGELAGRSSLRRFDAAFAAVVSWVVAQCNTSPRIGVFGVSFGGHLACRAVSLSPHVGAAVCLGGFFDFAALARLPEPAKDNLRRAYGLPADARVDELRAMIDLARLPSPTAPRILIVHGSEDHLADAAQVDQLCRWAPQATLRVWPGGEHVCTNLFAQCLPDIWDFAAASLQAGDGCSTTAWVRA